jgi:hypothetical protein
MNSHVSFQLGQKTVTQASSLVYLNESKQDACITLTRQAGCLHYVSQSKQDACVTFIETDIYEKIYFCYCSSSLCFIG